MDQTIEKWVDTAGLTQDDILTQFTVLSSEIIETMEGIVTKNRSEILDGLSDTHWMVTVVKYLTNNKFDLMDQYRECIALAKQYDDSISDEEIKTYQEAVLKSNFSKFCKTKKEVEKTVDKYNKIGVEVKGVKVGGLYVIRSIKDQSGSDKKSYPKNKILKSIDYKEPRAFMS